MQRAVKSLTVFLLFYFGVTGQLHAQNIYGGGSGDGFASSSVAQPDNILFNIYGGGDADGSATNSVAQPDNILFNIYSGGDDDGSATSSVAQPDNILFNIYQGGTEDGFAFNSFAQPDNLLYNIYGGGDDDGFAFSSFAQPDNVLFDIYKGGIGDGFSFTSLGSPPNEVALPIELLYLKGAWVSGYVLLEWETATELNNNYFSVERSPDGNAFVEIQRVNGQGTKTTNTKYIAKDHKPLPGLSYYRLNQVDLNGTSHLSKIIGVKAPTDLDEPFIVHPNPALDKFTLYGKGLNPGDLIQVELLSMLGISAGNYSFVADDAGILSRVVSVSDLSNGTYIVRIHSGDEVRTVKLIVVH